MLQITILSCTDRPGSNAWNVTTGIEPFYRNESVDVNLVSLVDFPLTDVAGGKYDDEIASVDTFNEGVLSADGLVLVVPEYNGGFPGILKLFFDYLPFPEALEHLPVALIGEAAGYFGALRPVEHLQDLLLYRRAVLYPERVFLPKIEDVLDEDGSIPEGSRKRRLQKQATGFVRFVSRLREESLARQS